MIGRHSRNILLLGLSTVKRPPNLKPISSKWQFSWLRILKISDTLRIQHSELEIHRRIIELAMGHMGHGFHGEKWSTWACLTKLHEISPYPLVILENPWKFSPELWHQTNFQEINTCLNPMKYSQDITIVSI